MSIVSKPQIYDPKLNPLAGIPIHETTYGRQYSASGHSDELRKNILKIMKTIIDGKKVEEISKDLSFTLVKKCNRKDETSSSLEYVTQKFGPKLQLLSGVAVEELVKQVKAYGQRYLLHHFFEPIKDPKDGDLVIYKGISKFAPSLCGIFREDKESLLKGGTVESKWGPKNPWVVQHDIFSIPPLFGSEVKFYRVKKKRVSLDQLAIKPHPQRSLSHLKSNDIYTIQNDDSLTFNSTEDNIKRRSRIKYRGDKLVQKVPEIEHLSYINFSDGGLCYHYAFGRILSTYGMCRNMLDPGLYGNDILKEHFTVTTAPQKGDLVVYYDSNAIEHWGIYLGNGKVESNWGLDSVYRHFLFDVPDMYGDTIKCYRLRDGLTADKLAAKLKNN